MRIMEKLSKTSHSDFVICAHRGASGTYPENTVQAYEAALWMGATMLEFDVRCSADQKCVVIHDVSVDRTTDGSGAVSELTFSQLRALNAGNGQRIPTLDEALDFADRALLNIHAYPITEDDRETISEQLLTAFAQRQIYHRAFVATRDLGLMQRLREEDSQIRLCNLTRPDVAEADFLQAVLDHHPCEVLQPRNQMVTKELVESAHQHGLKVNPFYADEPEEMRRLLDCGVDGILTNYPLRLAKLLKPQK